MEPRRDVPLYLVRLPGFISKIWDETREKYGSSREIHWDKAYLYGVYLLARHL